MTKINARIKRGGSPSRVAQAAAIGSIMLVCGMALVVAGSDQSSQAQERTRAAFAPVKQEILLMKSGRVVTGQIIANGNDFTVRLPSGEFFVPGSLVRMRCDSLRDAYDRLHDEIPDPYSPGQHITLARWCFANDLLAEARRELRDALNLEPSREETRELLRKVEDAIAGRRDELARASQPTLNERLASARENAEPAESLGGLSPENAQHFVRRIQPILINNCATARCHGPRDESPFRLERVSIGSDATRRAAEQNLASVLRYVDRDNPRASVLLTVPRGNHGRRGRPLFSGGRGAEQLDELQEWVQQAAADLSPAPRKKKTLVATADADAKPESQDPPVQPAAFEIESPNSSSADRDDVTTKRQADPFDPAEFNRGNRAP
jgi:hypothetical protein